MAGEEVALVLPQTFMNRSGEALGLILDEWPQFDAPQNLIVAYDDLDLPCGQIRLRRSGGAGGHRGMQSLIQVLGSGGFSRLRLGVGRPQGDEEVVDFVLSAFSSDQLDALETSMRHATEAVEHLIRFGMDSAMNQFN
ncbi:MAG: aminoacyl-tRNA hydrolase [Deltaproteobacteria bacterium]|nr:aminoacyl-tRNA hydrolase [Deltaproteobacteria bacterium]